MLTAFTLNFADNPFLVELRTLLNVTRIPPYRQRNIDTYTLTATGAAIPHAFDSKYATRIATIGANARTRSDAFTVACHFTHRRAWMRVLDSPTEVNLVLEHDAGHADGPRGLLTQLRELLATLGPTPWDTINLAPCWQFCKRAARVTSHVWRTPVSSCTTAYLVTRAGARRLLAHSLPYAMPVDYYMSFLSRVGELTQLTAHPSVSQHMRDNATAHDTTSAQLCDHHEEDIYPNMEQTDARLLLQIAESKFHPRTDPPRWYLCAATCTSDGPRTRLDTMALQLGIQRVVVWGLRDDHHTHAYIHHAIADFWRRETATPVCHVSERDAVDKPCEEGGDLLEHALVIASPKHMIWTGDPSLHRLTQLPSSYYVFHEIPPAHFVAPHPRVVQWIVRGHDGNKPILDAEHWVARIRYRCQPAQIECRFPGVLVAPWSAANETTSADVSTRDVLPRDVVNFVGTVWSVNRDAFCALVEGCAARGVTVHRYGMNVVPADVTCAFEDHRGRVDEETSVRLNQESLLVPCIQGSPHTDASNAYVSDRFLTHAASGRAVATNNRRVGEWFGVPVVPPERMCEMGGTRVDPTRLAPHTYGARFEALLRLLTPPRSI